MLRFLKRPTAYVLGMAVEAEKTHRERKLEREIRSLRKEITQLREDHDEDLLKQSADYDEALRVLHTQLHDCQQRNTQLEEAGDAKDREIERLSHQIDLQERDLEGMAVVNARMLRRVEDLRVAEEAAPESLLEKILKEKQSLETNYQDI